MKNSSGSNWAKWDLHIHSNASDGKGTPSEIISKAKERQLSVIALTDHHSVENIDETKKLGKENGITVIAGIEFRTEYGKKSVHMIGLFPDQCDGTTLTQENLYDLVLCKLGLSKAELKRIARTKQKCSNDEDAYRKGLMLATVDFKDAADIIHNLGGIVSVHSGNKANSIEEMYHENKNDTRLVDSLGTVKDELMAHYIDVCEITRAKDAAFYINSFGKPAIAASDAHSLEDIGKNYAWIKAETSFEGLKQIIYEPEARVKVQSNKPGTKVDYQIIDRLEIKHEDFGEQVIPFNEGLNTIIGGRSSGKSILLGAIAKLAGNKREAKKNKAEYNKYIDEIAKSMKLIWKDGSTEGIRNVEYFPQGHIIQIATDKNEISKLVDRIINNDSNLKRNRDELEQTLNVCLRESKNAYEQYEASSASIIKLSNELLELGNKGGIEKEIEKIVEQKRTISNNSFSEISQSDEDAYHNQLVVVSDIKEASKVTEIDIKQLKEVSAEVFIDDYDSLDYKLSAQVSDEVEKIYENAKDVFLKTWNEEIDKLQMALLKEIQENNEKANEILQSEFFIRMKSHYANNEEYEALQIKEKTERGKLKAINEKEESISAAKEMHKNAIQNILDNNIMKYNHKADYCSSESISCEDIVIVPCVEFNNDKFLQFVESRLDRRPYENQKILNYSFENIDSYNSLFASLIEKLDADTLTLKGGYKAVDIIKELTEKDWFEVRYDIRYQGDSLSEMSEGKASFVLLRLILDFENADCPILIDQPEDDLDNRAIYTDLVKYIKSKKDQRQIIIVTHNPNVVVAADSEEVIVANQNGTTNRNTNGIKFEYITGPLEQTFVSDTETLLRSQGIREHVCDILEGGKKAFVEREKKYNIAH